MGDKYIDHEKEQAMLRNVARDERSVGPISKVPPIAEQLDRFEMTLLSIEDTVNILRTRLEPIVYEQDENKTASQTEPDYHGSELNRRLLSYTEKAQVIKSRLNRILNGLEI